MMDEKQIKKAIEALLFVSEKAVPVEQFKTILEDVETGQIKKQLENLKDEYGSGQKGIQIVEVAGGYQFCTAAECSEYIKKLNKTKKVLRLSAPALETLAIIAYKQPITKPEIELIRGVNVEGVIKTLLERTLIKLKGRKEVPGRPILYGSTNEFLQYFGLNSLTDLPSLEEFTQQALLREEKDNAILIDEGELENGANEHTEVA